MDRPRFRVEHETGHPWPRNDRRGRFEPSLGLREAILQRVNAVHPGGPIEVSLLVCGADGKPVRGEPRTWTMSAETYWRDIPERFRNPGKYMVRRTIQLAFRPAAPEESVEVREIARGALAWASR